jgi:hypothetical protein
MRASDAMVLRPAMAATVLVIAFANMMFHACGLLEYVAAYKLEVHRVLCMYLFKHALQLIIRVDIIQNEKKDHKFKN